MSRPIVTSYADITEPCNGRSRRVTALLESLNGECLLIQPHRHHPACETEVFPIDLGRRKIGINWGIFNFHLPPNRRVAERTLKERKPKVIVLTSIFDFPVVRSCPDARILLDAENVDASTIEQQYGPKHWFTRRVDAVERRVLRHVDHVFVCSQDDHALFQSRYGVSEDRMSVVPNGVDIRAMQRDGDGHLPDGLRESLEGRTVLFFMGKQDYEPNREALNFMDTVLMPELEARAPGKFALLCLGGPRPKGLRCPSIIATGNVPHIQPYIARADICVAPLFKGGGTRLKILEYLGANKPVVVTPKAAEGIALANGVHGVITEAREFADRILELAGSPKQAAAMARAGCDHAAALYDWSGIKPGWSRVIERYSRD
ncbi:MAG: glycosyltransferase family 4 protein [Kiritimatiellia bacterium]